MTLKNKKTLLIVFISVLTLVNISAIVTFFYYSHHSHRVDNTNNKNCNRNRNRNHQNKSCLFVKNSLNLDDIQFEKYNELRSQNRNKAKQYVRNIRRYKNLTINELAKIETDSVLLSEYADSIGMQNKLLQLEMNNHFLKLKSILNDKQLVKFKKLLKKMEQRKKRHNHKNKRKYCD